MLAKQRYSKILELLEQNGIVLSSQLVKLMDVSSETIRKDLEYLDNQGLLSRVHGGAMPVAQEKASSLPSDYITLQTRNTQYMTQKYAIAKKAAEQISEGQVVALDFGSTSQIIAQTLAEQFRRLTVITNSIQNLLILAENPGITVILTGGVLNRNEYTLVDDFSSVLDKLHIDVMFMTVSGVDLKIGLTDLGVGEMRTQNQMHLASTRTIVTADSSKFGKASLLKICPITEADTIITDSGVEDQMAESIRALGVELIIV